jgi:hypothetical protein
MRFRFKPQPHAKRFFGIRGKDGGVSDTRQFPAGRGSCSNYMESK